MPTAARRLALLVTTFALATGCAARTGGSAPAGPSPERRAPVKVIYDTDMSLDVDDVGALAMLHAMADRGECEILAVVVSESAQHYDGLWVPPLVDVLNTYYGRPDIPIGVYRGPHQDIGRKGQYPEKVVRAGFPHDLPSGAETPDAKDVYRKALAGAPDGSVVIISVGYLTNLETLMRSGPDAHSPLDGMALIRRKVKEWSCMGGKYPASGDGSEFNTGHYPAASEHVINNWPGRAVFGGYELGVQYKTGAVLNRRFDPRTHPAAKAFLEYNGGKDRESWDQLAVLYGVRGLAHGNVTYFGAVTTGHNHFERLGRTWPKSTLEKSQNTWRDAPDKEHAYLVPAAAIEVVEAEIDALMTAR